MFVCESELGASIAKKDEHSAKNKVALILALVIDHERDAHVGVGEIGLFLYILITFMIDNKREYKRNFFLRDMSILLSHTRRQLGRANEDIVPGVYLKELIDNQTELDIWFEYPTVATRTGPKRVQNIAWLPPVTTEADDTPDFELPPM